MLFETEAEALAFIRFNSNDILKESRRTPVRCYYCQLCGGYHVTSNPSKTDAKRMDERDKAMVKKIDEIIKVKNNEKPTIISISEKMERANLLMTSGNLTEVERLLKECQSDLQIIRKILFRRTNPDTDALTRRETTMNRYLQKLVTLKKLTAANEEEQMAFIKKEKLTKEDEEIAKVLISIRAIAQIEILFLNIYDYIEVKEFEKANMLVSKCRKLTASIHGPGRKETIKHWKRKIDEVQHKVNIERNKMFEIEMEKKETKPETIVSNEETGCFDSIMDALFSKSGPPEREAFRREALEYCSQMEEKGDENEEDY
jgi:hypothetical protein